MPLKTFSSNKWPKYYGFDIVGDGPCFVAYVVHGSVAYNAGLKPGDQILELEDHDVSNMSLEALKKLAKNCSTQPPPVGVVSRYHQVDLVGSRTSGYGFTIKGDKPVTIESVEMESPATDAGLKPGDIILEVNGQTVKRSDEMKNFLSGRLRRMTLSLIPVSKQIKPEPQQDNSESSGIESGSERSSTSHGRERSDSERSNGSHRSASYDTSRSRSLHKRERHESDRSGSSHSFDTHNSRSSHKSGMHDLDGTRSSNRSERNLRSSRSDRLGKEDCIREPDNGLSKHSTPLVGKSRIKQARLLHNKMNEILGTDYEKKMATVSVLKQYAEDRDIDMLGRALKAILKTPQQKKIMKQIRPFIPPRQRHRFDDFIKENEVLNNHEDDISPGTLRNGVNYSHAHLVQLLQNSDSAPQVEVMRTGNDIGSVRLNGSMHTRTPSTLSLASTTTSHASSDWQSTEVQKDGKTFKQSAYYLLTSKERSQLKKAMLEYDSRKNVVDLHKRLTQILDTHSKKTLWRYILPILPTEHMDYCVSKGGLPRSIIQELKRRGTNGRKNHDKNSNSSFDLRHSTWSSKASSSTLVNHDTDFSSPSTPTNGPHFSSFKKQMEFLLTSRERMQLKKALQIYSKNRKIDNLILDMNVILDTPSKQSLWNYIVQLLSSAHQEYTIKKLNLMPSSKASDQSSVHITDFLSSTEPSPRMPRKNLLQDGLNGLRLKSQNRLDDWRRSYENLSSSEDDAQYRTLKAGVRRSRGRLWKTMHPGFMYSYDDMDARDGTKGFDIALLKELEQTRRAVQEAKRMFLGANRGENHESNDSDSDDDPANKYVTVIPVGFGEQEEKDKSPSSSLRLKSSLKNPIPYHKQNGGLTRTGPNFTFVITESNLKVKVILWIMLRAGILSTNEL
ncbi:unnamed protein product [Mytilus coruscus]|uniref:PDZ domain-containing protein n=1 Tax=Mytilus coruscus TaxID=42192 RepID=A0A6J8A922_MYTCO|nr:unnamed protein product [Mytilus coruscus]